MLPAFRPPVFRGTPETPGTGWFDREGLSRKLAGHYSEEGTSKAKRAKPYALVEIPCGRCGGAGGSDKWAHTGWTCFDCQGRQTKGTVKVRLYTVEELAVLNERRDASRAKKLIQRQALQAIRDAQLAEKAAERASLLADWPFYQEFKTLMETFTEVRPAPNFLREMFTRIQTENLTEKQEAAVRKFIASRVDWEARKVTSEYIGTPGDRIEVVAKVVMCREMPSRNSQYEPGGPSYLIKFDTRDHQTLTWFTSRQYTVGATLEGRATIKGHREFGGVKETQISNFRARGEIDGKQQELF